MPVPLLWLRHQKYFLFSNVLTNVPLSLVSVSWGGGGGGGGGFFHVHFSLAFCFLTTGFLGATFLAACFLPVCFSLLVLLGVLQHSFLKELISMLIVTNFSCSSVGLPHAFSSLRSRASYLFLAWIMRSSAVKVAQLSSHWLLNILGVYNRFVIWGSFVCLPEVVEEVYCLLLPGVKMTHLVADPLVEFSDVAFQQQQLLLGFD